MTTASSGYGAGNGSGGTGTGAAGRLPAVSARTARALVTAPHGGSRIRRSSGGLLDWLTARPWGAALVRYAWVILLMVAGAVALAAALTAQMTPLYRAAATVELLPRSAAPQTVSDAGTRDATFLETQYALLHSRTLAARAVDALGLDRDPRYASPDLSPADARAAAAGKVVRRLDVIPARGNSRIVTLRYRSDKPDEAAAVPNALAAAFREWGHDRDAEATARARETLSASVSAARGEMESRERALSAFARDNAILRFGDAGGEGALDANTIVAVNGELIRAEGERMQAEQRFLAARDRPNAPAFLADPDIQALEAQRAELRATYEQELLNFKPEYPAMQALRARIDIVEDEIATRREAVLDSLEADYFAAIGRERALQDRVAALRDTIASQQETIAAYAALKRDASFARDRYEDLAAQQSGMATAAAARISPSSLVDAAVVPDAPYSPNMARNVGAALVLGLGGGLGLALGLGAFTDTVRSPTDLRRKLAVAPIGVIPRTGRDGSVLEALADPESALFRSFESAGAALHYTSQNGVPRSLLLSSARGGEGKSSSAASLALMLANSGKRVLIIDADLRKPTFQAGPSGSVGLVGLLTSTEDLFDHVIYSGRPNLALLPSGPIPPDPTVLLRSERFIDLIRQAEKLFDVVLIDTPPVLEHEDAEIVSKACEAALMVVEANGMRCVRIADAVVRLSQGRARVLGALLTKLDPRKAGRDADYYFFAYGAIAEAETGRLAEGEGVDRPFDILGFNAKTTPAADDAVEGGELHAPLTAQRDGVGRAARAARVETPPLAR